MTVLKLTFDPMTIEHLGFKMYSHLPNAVAELIANSYDADARHVSVTISPSGDSIRIDDDGHGMSIAEIQENYLKIGRNRREATHSDTSESGRRKTAGRKGLGKLSVFGIGNTIVVETKRAGSPAYARVTLIWGDIKRSSGSEYQPELEILPGKKDEHFTRILIKNLSRKTEIKPLLLAQQLSRLFNYTDADFLLEVNRENDRITVDRRLRYDSITTQAEWAVPAEFRAENPGTIEVTGKIIAAARPLPAHLRGVTLYVRGRMANEPEFFGVPDSSQAYAYLSGYIDADDLDSEADVISTDRRSVGWETESASHVQKYLAAVLREAATKHRALRQKKNKEKAGKDAGVDIEAWASTIRGPESEALREVIDTLVSPDNDIQDDDRHTIITSLRRIAPDYADLHWRALHSAIQGAAEDEYKSENYHHAVVEAIKQYVKDVRRIGGQDSGMAEHSVLQSAFAFNSEGNPLVDVVGPYAQVGLAPETEKNLREAQKALSVAAWTGFRNPIQHESVRDLRNNGVFSYQDCLDALSLVSHLRRRLGKIEDQPEASNTPLGD